MLKRSCSAWRGAVACEHTPILHAIAFKKKIFAKTRLSRLGQFSRETTECKHFFWCIGKLEQCLLDLLGQRLKGREIMQVGVLLFDLLPQLLNWVVVWRIGRQLEDLQPCGLLGEEGLGLGTGMILRPILNQDDVLRGLLEHTREKGNVGRGVEAAFLPLIKEAPGEGINQAKDLVAFA